MRVAVLSPEGKPLMPTKPSRARRWLKEDKAHVVKNALKVFTVQLIEDSSGISTQACVLGVDPGKLYSGVAVQTASDTLWLAHLQLPFKTIKERVEQRRRMRRGRRGRRINRKIVYKNRAHRQKRFDNRRGDKLPPSIKASRQLEIGVVKKLLLVYPLTCIVWEKVVARGSIGFTPVMQASHGYVRPLRYQYWAIKQLESYLPVIQLEGWETSNSNADWKRLGQFSVKKVQLLQRSTGLIVVPSRSLSNLPLLKGSI